jgi:hypothetical protein
MIAEFGAISIVTCARFWGGGVYQIYWLIFFLVMDFDSVNVRIDQCLMGSPLNGSGKRTHLPAKTELGAFFIITCMRIFLGELRRWMNGRRSWL